MNVKAINAFVVMPGQGEASVDDFIIVKGFSGSDSSIVFYFERAHRVSVLCTRAAE